VPLTRGRWFYASLGSHYDRCVIAILALVQPILTGIGHYSGSIIRLAR